MENFVKINTGGDKSARGPRSVAGGPASADPLSNITPQQLQELLLMMGEGTRDLARAHWPCLTHACLRVQATLALTKCWPC